MARTEKTYRTEVHLNRGFTEDLEVIEWLESCKSKSGAIRDVLIEYVTRSRVARQQEHIAGLEQEVKLLRKVVSKLTDE